jgi:hypothetical protein
MAYRNKIYGSEDGSFEGYTQRELQEVEKAFNHSDFIQLKVLGEAPKKLKDGLMVFADGTGWNPGSGAGFYGYYGGSWKKLG